MDPTFPEAQGILGSFKGRILLPGYSTPLFKADIVKGFCKENNPKKEAGQGAYTACSRGSSHRQMPREETAGCRTASAMECPEHEL